jgi:outer membrane protein assembly factor BamB
MIEEMGLGEVIQALSLNRHRGTLRIEGEEGISKFFYLSDGEIVLIRTVKSEPVRIGELLVRAGKIDHEQLEAALTLQKETRQRLGDALIALGHVTSHDVDQVVRGKFEEEFLDVFLLDRGHFEFIFGLSPESLFSPDEKLERIALNTSALMLEAMRRVDDWQSMRRELGSLDEIYKNRNDDMAPRIEEYTLESVILPPNVRREVYESLDGRRTIREVLAVAQNQGASRLHCFQFIHACKQNDLIRTLDAPTCLEQAKAALDLGDAAETAKFIRAVMAKERIELPLIRRYIEFLRKAERPQLARRECKTLAAQYLAAGDVDAALTLYQLAHEIDARDTEVLDRLFYAHLRKSDVTSALEVGFMFRDYMQRESDLPIVARVVKNMRELEPEDSRVLEISGLLLKRQERIEEARRELDRALASVRAHGGTVERQAAIVQALLDLDPKQAALAREKEKLERDVIVAAAHAQAAKRLKVFLAAAALVVAVLLALSELGARRELAAADRLAETANDLQSRLRAHEAYLIVSHRISTIGGAATAKAQAIQDGIDHELQGLNVQHEIERQKADHDKDERDKKAHAEKAKQEVTDALAAIDAARAAKDWKQAAARATTLYDSSKDLDPRAAAVTVPVRVVTTPAGARAWIEASDGVPASECRTPGTLEAPPHKPIVVRIAKPGYATISTAGDTNAYWELELPLDRGPAWRAELDGPIAGAVAADAERAFAVAKDGRAFGIALADGKSLWKRAVAPAGSAEALGDPAPPGVAQGVLLVGGHSGVLVGLDVASGEEKWRLRGDPILNAPVSAEVDGRERAIVCRGNALAVVDATTGKVEREVALPAAPVAPPVARNGRAAAVLVDGRCAVVDVVQGKVLWAAEAKLDPVGAPVIATELGFVLAASREGSVVALALKDGATVYRRTQDLGPLEGGLAVEEGRIYVSTTRGRLFALDASDGRTLWDQLDAGPLVGPARHLGTSIFAVLKTGDVVEHGVGDGKKRGTFHLDEALTAATTLAGPKLLVPAGSALYALERAED